MFYPKISCCRRGRARVDREQREARRRTRPQSRCASPSWTQPSRRTSARRSARAPRRASRRAGCVSRASSSDGSDLDRDRQAGSRCSSRRGVLRAASSARLLLPALAPALPARADDLFCGYYVENRSVTPQWAFKTPWSEGAVDVSSATNIEGAKTFLRILGGREAAAEAGHLPVLCLHGGPGLGFKYMESCEVLASEKREVASYDANRLRAVGAGEGSAGGRRRARALRGGARETQRGGRAGQGARGRARLGSHARAGPRAGPGSARERGRVARAGLVPAVVREAHSGRARDALNRMPRDMAEALVDGDENGARGSNLSDAGRALYARAWQEWVIRHESARAAGACYDGLSLGGAGARARARGGDAPTAAGAASRARGGARAGGMYFTAGGALADWGRDAGGRLRALRRGTRDPCRARRKRCAVAGCREGARGGDDPQRMAARPALVEAKDAAAAACSSTAPSFSRRQTSSSPSTTRCCDIFRIGTVEVFFF